MSLLRQNLASSSLYATLFAVLLFVVNPSTVQAQPGRGGPLFGGDSGLGLLNDEKVQAELDLMEDQAERLSELRDEQRDAMREMFEGMREEFRGQAREDRQAAMQNIREKLQDLNSEYDERSQEILLPHQIDRLKQLQFQARAQRSGGAGQMLVNGSMAEQLNITEEQMESLKTKAAEVRKSMEEKIAKIREEAQQDVMSVLTEEQQAKLKELMGESFDFGERGGQNWRAWGGDRRGGRRGGPGGPSGPRRGDDSGGSSDNSLADEGA